MAANRVILLSPTNIATPTRRGPSPAEIRSQIRATQQARSRLAAQVARSATRSSRSVHSVSHALTLGFDSSALATPGFSDRAQQVQERWMKHVREQRGVADFRVEREGSTAILYGTAPSEEEVDLLARTIRLEPGVYEVESRMQVQSPAEEF
jgi:hypothetical protein